MRDSGTVAGQPQGYGLLLSSLKDSRLSDNLVYGNKYGGMVLGTPGDDPSTSNLSIVFNTFANDLNIEDSGDGGIDLLAGQELYGCDARLERRQGKGRSERRSALRQRRGSRLPRQAPFAGARSRRGALDRARRFRLEDAGDVADHRRLRMIRTGSSESDLLSSMELLDRDFSMMGLERLVAAGAHRSPSSPSLENLSPGPA